MQSNDGCRAVVMAFAVAAGLITSPLMAATQESPAKTVEDLLQQDAKEAAAKLRPVEPSSKRPSSQTSKDSGPQIEVESVRGYDGNKVAVLTIDELRQEQVKVGDMVAGYLVDRVGNGCVSLVSLPTPAKEHRGKKMRLAPEKRVTASQTEPTKPGPVSARQVCIKYGGPANSGMVSLSGGPGVEPVRARPLPAGTPVPTVQPTQAFR